MTCAGQATSSLAGRRILVVEDDYYQAADIARTLKNAGAEIVGPTALASAIPGMLHNQRIDSAVVDINLGSGITFEVARCLQTAEVPYILMTGYDRFVAPEGLSATCWLTKPVPTDEIVTIVKQMVGEPMSR